MAAEDNMPNPVTGHTRNAWRIVGQGLDFYVDVPAPHAWQYPRNARLIKDPMGGSPQLLILGDVDIIPKREGSFTFGAYQGMDRNVTKQKIFDAWMRVGPYTLTFAWGETMQFIFNQESNPLDVSSEGYNRLFKVALQEV